MMTKAKWALMVALLALSATGCATTDTGAKLDYQSLKGTWEWDYPVGYNILTIESVTPRTEKVYLLGYYEASSVSLGINTLGKGRTITGTIDLRHEPKEIVFKFKSGSQINLYWNGGGRLWGSCMFKTWSGDCEFNKK